MCVVFFFEVQFAFRMFDCPLGARGGPGEKVVRR